MCSLLFQVTASELERYINFFPSLESLKTGNPPFFRPWTDRGEEFPNQGVPSCHNQMMTTYHQSIPSCREAIFSDGSINTGSPTNLYEQSPGPLVHDGNSDSSCEFETDSSNQSTESSRIEDGRTCLSRGDLRKASRRRKPSRPRRSAAANDPSFRGVTVSVQTELARRKWTRKLHSRLLIKSYFSVRRVKGLRALRRRRFSQLRICYPSGSNTALSPTWSSRHPSKAKISNTVSLGTKQCASCCTRRTPLWRDSEDGTPLCNACGIRYKKYRLRCIQCWFIPRKDCKSYPHCARCGTFLRMAILRKSKQY